MEILRRYYDGTGAADVRGTADDSVVRKLELVDATGRT